MTNNAPCAGWVSIRSLPRGPSCDIADERPAVRVGYQIEHAVAAITGAAGCHDLDETAQTALSILLGETGNLRVKRRLGLTLDEIGTRPIHKQQDAGHR